MNWEWGYSVGHALYRRSKLILIGGVLLFAGFFLGGCAGQLPYKVPPKGEYNITRIWRWDERRKEYVEQSKRYVTAANRTQPRISEVTEISNREAGEYDNQ